MFAEHCWGSLKRAVQKGLAQLSHEEQVALNFEEFVKAELAKYAAATQGYRIASACFRSMYPVLQGKVI